MAKIEPRFETIFEVLLRLVNAFFGSLKNATKFGGSLFGYFCRLFRVFEYPPTGGWWDRKDATHPFRRIVDVTLFAAMGLPGGGRTFITLDM